MKLGFQYQKKISAIRTHYYPNISFISYDGVNWIDLYDYVLNLSERGHNYNSAVACIKTFTIFNLTTTTVLNEVSRDKNNVNLTATVKDQYGHLINEGYVIFEYGGEKYNRSLLNGIANLSIKNLNDNITIRATYENNSHYLSSNDELRVFVQKYDVNLTMNIGNIYYGEYFKVNTSLTCIFGDLIDSYLVLTIGNKSYNISSNHVFIVPDLFDPSNYDVSIYYKGSNRYNESESNLNMTVNKNDVNLDVTANDITYGEYLTFYVSLSSNSKLINENVILNINGKYTFTANNKFILPIILEASSYNFHIYYCGNKIYNPNNIIKMVNVSKINPKLEFKIKDVKYGQDIIAEVKLTGINDLLLNENVILTLNNKNYTFKANNNHVLPIKLNASIYNAIVFFEGDNNYNNDYSIISFVVDKSEVELSLAIQNITYGDNLIINNNINHDVIVKINSKTFSIKENSIYQIPDLFDAGNYQGIVIFEGDNNYKNNTQIINFSIHKFTPELKLNFSDINYGKHILADAGLIGINKSLLYESLRLTINNENFNFKSNDKFYIPILLNASNYIVNVIYNGNTNYNSISDKINVNVNKINPKLIFNISDTCYGSDLVITNYLTGINQELINESLILSINNKEYKVNSNNIYILPDILDVGQYSAFITFNGNNNYNKIKSEVSFNVNLKNVDMNLTVNKNLNNVSISVKLSDSINDTINVRINNQNYDIKNGDILNLNNLNLGQYWVEVLFNKTGYKTLFIKDNFTVDSINTLINVNNIVMYYRDGTRLTGVLTDSNANILSNKSISILINGVKYTRNTDDKGVFSLNLGLNPNLYTTTLKFMGDSNYINSSKEIMVDIKSTIDSNGLIKYYKNASQFHATILDYAGNLVINTEIVMNINGVFYKRVTDSRGVVSLNINLYPGNYILTLYNPITDETRGLNITVLSIIVDNHDLVKYYRNASRYSVKLLDGKGSLLSDAHIIFNINGIFYERQTDSDGIASLAINLEPNTYIITAYYGDLAISNSIEVLSTIKSNDIVMRYKDGTQFNVTILDGVGKQYSNQKVIFNINGVFYTRITDSNGIAALNINLQAGKYIITSSYNGLNVGNTVTIKNI